MTAADRIDCDVLIVGGGLVGSLLANAFAGLPLDVVLVEARNAGQLEQPGFDSRVTALANGSQRVLEQLGLWATIAPHAQPITHIHIGERGRFGAARINARDEGVPALGFTVENRVLGQAFWEPLRSIDRFRCLSPANVVEFSTSGTAVSAEVEVADSATRFSVCARLMVAADGARSGLRNALGIKAEVDDYQQNAIIVNCVTQEPHRGRAWERFTVDGPLAVLPLTGDRVGVVWTLPTDQARAMLELSDKAFAAALQAAFGFRLGMIERVGRRDAHPLYRVRSSDLVRQRTVLLGSSALALHPVAGQGFNLALRDAASLAEIIADGVQDGAVDPGDDGLLDSYRRWRTQDQRKLAGFTHALVRGFGVDVAGLNSMRGVGLLVFDLLPGAKSFLARQTMGLSGRVPKLARHLGLAG